MKRALLFTIRLYQRFVSPLLLPACRYVPSCSQYASEAVEFHGPWKGALLAAWRLLRCHPLARGGFDPVPADHVGQTQRRLSGMPQSCEAPHEHRVAMQ
jgi:putative membrane protein insertion efficiency factor